MLVYLQASQGFADTFLTLVSGAPDLDCTTSQIVLNRLLLLILLTATIAGAQNPHANHMNLKMQVKSKGEGQPLVLVPGGLTGWVSWDSFVDHFAASHKVIQVQLLSVQYGIENKALPVDYSVRSESLALKAALDSVEFSGKANFIGWSYGGMVLLDYALNNPDKVNTLTLIEPPAWWIIRDKVAQDQNLKSADKFLSTVPGIAATITEGDLESFLSFAGFARPGSSIRDLPQWKAWVTYRQSLRSNSAVYKHVDKRDRLRAFDRPVLLVKGTGSSYFLHQIVETSAVEFPNARLVEFPGGHAPHLASRDQFLNAVQAFWSENPIK
jgi:pimeloyl-ACP methyl ester carboxylesterase